MIKKIILILINILVIFFFIGLYWQYFRVIESVTEAAKRKAFMFLIPVLLFVFNYYFEKHIVKSQKFILTKVLITIDLVILFYLIAYPIYLENFI